MISIIIWYPHLASSFITFQLKEERSLGQFEFQAVCICTLVLTDRSLQRLSTTTRKSWEVACLTDLLEKPRWQADGNLHRLGRPGANQRFFDQQCKKELAAAAFQRKMKMINVNQIGLRNCHLTHCAWIPDTRKHTLVFYVISSAPVWYLRCMLEVCTHSDFSYLEVLRISCQYP